MSELNWNDLLSKVSTAAHAAGEAARSAAQAARLALAIAGEEEKIRAAYQAIGKQYVQDRTAGISPVGPVYDRELARVRDANARIQELRRETASAQPAPEKNGSAIPLPDGSAE